MKPIIVPKIRDHSEILVGLEEKAEDLRQQLLAAEKERAGYLEALSRSGSLALEEPTDPAAQRVAVLLGEAPPPVVPEHRERLVVLAQQIHDLRRAHGVMLGRIAVEKAKQNAAIIDRFAPEYKARIRAVCDALRTVHAANVELRALTDALEAEDVIWTGLGVVMPKVIGMPTDPYSPIAMYLREASEFGFIDKGEIPQEMRFR